MQFRKKECGELKSKWAEPGHGRDDADSGGSPLEPSLQLHSTRGCQQSSFGLQTSALLLAGMAPSRKRKLRNSTVDSLNFLNGINGLSALSRRDSTHRASTPPQSARPSIFDITETPPKHRRNTPPHSEPFPRRQLRSRKTDFTTFKVKSTPNPPPPGYSPFVHEETDESAESQDDSTSEQGLGQDYDQGHNSNADEGSEEVEARWGEEKHGNGSLDEDPSPDDLVLWTDESEHASDKPSDEDSANSEDQPTSYQRGPKSDEIEVLIDNRTSVDQTKGLDFDDGLFVSSASENEQRDEDDANSAPEEPEGWRQRSDQGEEEYVPEESEGEEQRARQLGAISSVPADAEEHPEEAADEQGVNYSPADESSSHRPRPRKNELQDLSRWLSQEIESSPEGPLWEILRDTKRSLRNVAVKPIPEYLKGANCEITEMRQLYYDIVNNSNLTSEAKKELKNLREAVRTEATRIFEYAAEEAPEETGEGAEMLNQFEAHVVGPIITLATFGYRAHKMLGPRAYEQFQGILELLLWCATQIANYATTSYLRGTRARSKGLLFPLKRIMKALGMGTTSRPASRVSSRVSSSTRPTLATQPHGDSSFYTQDDNVFTQRSQGPDFDIPPSQRPWSSEEEKALRDGALRFSGRSLSSTSFSLLVFLGTNLRAVYGDPIPLVMSHHGHILRRRTCRDLRAKLDELRQFDYAF